MTSGARNFGDRGCLGGFDRWGVVFWLDSALCNPVGSDAAISAFSSNAGPSIRESMLSPKTL